MADRPDDSPTTRRTALSPGPTSPAPSNACVVIIHGEGLGQRVDVVERPIVVGRSTEADLHIGHSSVSRRHCQIWREGESYLIRDLGSTNRTLVNDTAVETAALVDGDHVTIGQSILKFISHSSVEARYHEEVYQLATHDALTEIYNRRHFAELVDREISRAQRHARTPVMCIIDVDLFKPINDRHGHVAGDGVLRQLGEILRRHVRREDIAARIGGEEFAVFFPEADLEAARLFAERFRQAVEDSHFAPGGEPRCITVSVGIAALGGERVDRGSLMRAADMALYRAKAEGRNRVCVEA